MGIYTVKRLMMMDGPGKKRKGRLKSWWMDRRDHPSGEEEQDRAAWRRLLQNIDPT